MRRSLSAIAEKGLQALATAANMPWRRNIRLENAKLHLRSFKSIGGKSDFYDLAVQKHFGGNRPFRAGSPGASNRKQLNPNLNSSGLPEGNLPFWEKLQYLSHTANVTKFALFKQFAQ